MNSPPVFIRISYGFRSLLLLIFLTVFLASCSNSTSTIRKSDIQPLKIISSTISKDVKKSGGLSVPVQPAKKFTTDDKTVVSHVAFSHLTGTHNIRWDWYDPNGTLFMTTGNYELKTRKNMYVKEGAVFHKIELKNSDAANHSGDWKVKIYIDDELAAIDDFSVQKVMSYEDIAKIDFGNYHALVIGNNDYESLPKLISAKKDAQDVANLLKNKYGFKTTLKLDATRSDIIITLDQLRKNLTPKDNLLIYYAGHGSLDKPADEGYWLPVDATEDSQLNWISSSQITTNIKAIPAKHVLVVADSCYAGTLTRNVSPRGVSVTKTKNEYQSIVERRIRSVMCSGGLEPVLDGSGKDGHSVFASAFLDVLDSNEGIIDGLELFYQLRRLVTLNASQKPEYSDIRRAGHDSGDFIFVRNHLVKKEQ